MTNPLLSNLHLPLFNEIEIDHIEPAIDQVLKQNREEIAALIEPDHTFTWNNLMAPLEAIQDRLDRLWSPVSHMQGVTDSDALRKAYNACLPKLTGYYTEVGQNKKLFDAIKSLSENKDYNKLSIAQKKIIENDLRDFHLSGIDLEESKKKQFAELTDKLSQLSTKFSENVLDAAGAFTLHIENEHGAEGIPKHALDSAKERAEQMNKKGWVFTLEQPDFLAIMQYADSAHIRQQMYEAFVTRASDAGPNAGMWDNTQVMFDIIDTKKKMAQLLGFNNAAELSLATKMAKNTEEVMSFLHNLVSHARPFAKIEFSELEDFASKTAGIKKLNAWDVAYFSEKLRIEKYDISQETLRPYFQEDRVLLGMFKVVHTLYDINIKQITDVQTWHEDVKFFEITDNNGTPKAYFYLDLYSRKHKRDGAWMDECRIRRYLDKDTVQLPVAYLTCNFAKPAKKGQPALLTHDDVITLFHEFGHGLHHMLTTIDFASVSGINGVAWDAVELPSQFLENWCWQPEVLQWISCHVDTGEHLPDDLLEKMNQAKNYHAGLQMLRQCEFSMFDFMLHSDFDAKNGSAQVQNILDVVRAEIAVVPVAPFNRFQHGFSHIFAGGYGAGYYSYKWAEVLSCDAFSLFEEKGIFDKSTGKAFLDCILTQGGSEDMDVLFKNFRGRAPTTDALLRHSGLGE